jgi:CoA:oxalate CoA-transferase
LTSNDAHSCRAQKPPLDGIQVIDFSTFLAGPFCTQILADLGADVVKVEPPQGDPTRTLPPHFHRGESGYFMSVNRSKRSVVLDLTNPAGKAVMARLVERADVVVENYRPSVATRLGVDYDSLAAINPRVIACSISGFGQDGPYAGRPAYDMIVQAMSGGMSITGEPDGRPVRSGIPIGDLNAGQFAAIAITSALLERVQSGAGQHIDISMLDAQIAMLSYLGVYHLMSGEIPGPQGRGHSSIPTYTALPTRDGRDVLICANTERMWAAVCDVLGIGQLVADPAFRTNDLRLANRERLMRLLEDAASAFDSLALVEALTRADVPCARINNVAEALADPQVTHRNMVRDVPHALGGTVRLLGNPVRFSRSPGSGFQTPPVLGQHTEAVLAQLLDMSPADIARQRSDGAFGKASEPQRQLSD